jgi:hypothetical protein
MTFLGAARVGFVPIFAVLFFCIGAWNRHAEAETDEIQVYTAEINEPGEFTLQLHTNYTPSGRREPDFPGGLVPHHTFNSALEWAYGTRDWLELGMYLPVYSVTEGGHLLWDAAKLRTLFALPHADERPFFYGINFELSYNTRRWEQHRFTGEIRPIVGGRIGPIDLIANPILDTSFNGFNKLDFAPAERIAYHFSKIWTGAVEHYADYGAVEHFLSGSQRMQILFAVIDYDKDPNHIEFGVGHGFTHGSDLLVIKLMITREI